MLILKDQGGNRYYVCLPFCKSRPEGREVLQKKEATENGSVDFEIGDIGTSTQFYRRLNKISC